jgi:hypothetical protein
VTDLPVLQDRPGADFGPGHYAPVWEQAPAPHDPSIINLDLLSHPSSTVYHGMWETRLPVMSEVTDLDFFYGGAIRDNVDHPAQLLMHPVYPTSVLTFCGGTTLLVCRCHFALG